MQQENQTASPVEPKFKNTLNSARRSDRYEKKLAVILKAASEVFAERGFDGASVRAVAARAGISLSGIYYYFVSKEQLLFALQRQTFKSLIELLESSIEQNSNPDDKLRALISNHIDYFANNMDRLKVCAHELNSIGGKPYEWVLEYRREYFELAKQVVSELCHKSKRDSAAVDPSLVTLFLFGSLNWMHMWYDSIEHKNTELLKKQLTALYMNGLS